VTAAGAAAPPGPVTVRVTVRTRPDLLDPEAEAILEVLRGMSPALAGLTLGRTFDLRFDGLDPAAALAEASRLAEEALRQPVLEEAAASLAAGGGA
jgi:phosphoribosylformylglycinamidine (FGAM) synthase PurS component